MSANIFAYGTLMFAQVWEAVASRRYPSEEARISGHVRKRVRGMSYPCMIDSEPDNHVDGRVYFDVDDEDIHRLDLFEGDLYERCCRKLVLADGRAVMADTYIIKDRYRQLVDTVNWDPDGFEKTDMAEFMRTYQGFSGRATNEKSLFTSHS